MNNLEVEKQVAATEALKYIDSGMVIGLGTGSTAAYFIKALSDKLKSKELKNIKCVSSSNQTTLLAEKLDLDLLEINDVTQIDVTIDGTDQFDANLNLIKGGGGAFLREKIIASLSSKFIIIADSTKKVESLAGFKIPVEVFTFSYKAIQERLNHLGFKSNLRRDKSGNIIVTDNQNYILDLLSRNTVDIAYLKKQLEAMPGIIEHGLFINYADLVLMGENDNITKFNKSLEC